MSLRIVAALVTLPIALSGSLAADKKAPPPSDNRQTELDALIQDFVKARRAVSMAMRSAKSDEERQAAHAKMPREADFLPRVHKLVAGGANDDVAAEALAFAVFGLNTKDEKIFDTLSKHFVKTDKIKRFVQMAANGAPDSAKPVLESVLAANPTRELQGLACYALATMAFEKEGEKPAKEAEGYFVRIEKQFADVKSGRETLGELAKGSLFELRNLQVGMKAPPTSSKTLKGEKTSLSDHLGKVVVLDFWATFCPPCRAMIPHEREMAAKFRDRPFVLISVSIDDEKKELEEFLERESMPWTHWWEGGDAPIVAQWNVRFVPKIFVIDAKGTIRFRQLHGAELESAVEKLLAEVKPR